MKMMWWHSVLKLPKEVFWLMEDCTSLSKVLLHPSLLASMNQPKALSAIEVRHVFVSISLNVEIMSSWQGDMISNLDRELGETILQTSFRPLRLWTSILGSLICARVTGGECGRRQGVMKLYFYLILFTWFIGSGEEVLPPATGNQDQCYWKYQVVCQFIRGGIWPQSKPDHLE